MSPLAAAAAALTDARNAGCTCDHAEIAVDVARCGRRFTVVVGHDPHCPLLAATHAATN